jgi:uncharacterized protein
VTRSRRVLLVLLAPAAIGVWGFAIEPGLLRVVERPVAVPAWPAGAPMRIALLSDLHVGSPRNGPDNLRRIVARTNAAAPDLVLLLGDFVHHETLGGKYVEPETIEEIIVGLRAPWGVFAVLGNHDLGLNGRRITRALERAGIRVLSDRAVRIDPADGRHRPFWLAGVSDLLRGAHDVAGTLAQVTDDGPILLMTHNPDLFPEIPPRVALTVAGHTHGGQVYLPFIGRPVVPSAYGQRFAAGLVIEDGRRMFVATGIGTSILPVRFLVPPEITILRIEPPSGGGA